MRRLICFVLCMCTIFGLAGCACNKPLNTDPPEVQIHDPVTATPTQRPVVSSDPVITPNPIIPDSTPKSEWGRGRDTSEEEQKMIESLRLILRNDMAEYVDEFKALKLEPVLCLGKKGNVSCVLCRVDLMTYAFTLSYYELYYVEKGENDNYTIKSSYQINFAESEKAKTWMQPIIGKATETWTPSEITDLTESKVKIFDSACKSEAGKKAVNDSVKKYGTSFTAEKYVAVRSGDGYKDHCFLCSVDGRETYCFVFIRQNTTGESTILSVSYSDIAKMIDAALRFDE